MSKTKKPLLGIGEVSEADHDGDVNPHLTHRIDLFILPFSACTMPQANIMHADDHRARLT